MRFQNFLFNFIFVFLCLLLVSGCASKEANLDKTTPVVVRILDLDSISVILTTPVLPTYTPMAAATCPVLPIPTQISPTQEQLPSENITSTPPVCTNQAEFIKHLTINDNAALEGGEHFAKIWRIKNIGTCSWTTSYSLVFSGGEAMGGPQTIPLSQEVKPGDTIDLRIDLTAPLNAQTYIGNWMLQDPAGTLFGIGELFDQPLSVIIVVKPPSIPIHT